MPARPGWVEAAQGGSLLFKAIEHLPASLHPRLLQLLDGGTYRRVGSSELRQADVRIVATTSIDLRSQVQAQQWPAALYYRLSALPLLLPPLRERGADVLLLADGLLQRLAPGHTYTLCAAAQQALLRHPWPGNLHELRNVLQRVLLLTEGRSISGPAMAQALALDATPPAAAPGGAKPRQRAQPPSPGLAPGRAQHTSGTRQEQARALGVSERTLYRRLRDWEKNAAAKGPAQG